MRPSLLGLKQLALHDFVNQRLEPIVLDAEASTFREGMPTGPDQKRLRRPLTCLAHGRRG